MVPLNPTVPANELAHWISEQASSRGRYLFGLAGPPGSGKTTVTTQVAAELGAVVVPMDGYHMPNSELDRLGWRSRKGAPETFAANEFVAMLQQLRHGSSRVAIPDFDRTVDEPRPNRIYVEASATIVIVEGNYLLLDTEPWNQITNLLDAIAYLDVDTDVRIERLVSRHVQFGKTQDEAAAFVQTSDERNTSTIAAARDRAGLFVTA